MRATMVEPTAPEGGVWAEVKLRHGSSMRYEVLVQTASLGQVALLFSIPVRRPGD
jgi:hypothetical protein